jgi:hypothetical protein
MPPHVIREFATLVDLLNGVHKLAHGPGVGKDILRSMSSILLAEPKFKDTFRTVDGFRTLATALAAMGGSTLALLRARTHARTHAFASA